MVNRQCEIQSCNGILLNKQINWAIKWINFWSTLSKRSQIQRSTYYMIPLTWNSRVGQRQILATTEWCDDISVSLYVYKFQCHVLLLEICNIAKNLWIVLLLKWSILKYNVYRIKFTKFNFRVRWILGNVHFT